MEESYFFIWLSDFGAPIEYALSYYFFRERYSYSDSQVASLWFTFLYNKITQARRETVWVNFRKGSIIAPSRWIIWIMIRETIKGIFNKIKFIIHLIPFARWTKNHIGYQLNHFHVSAEVIWHTSTSWILILHAEFFTISIQTLLAYIIIRLNTSWWCICIHTRGVWELQANMTSGAWSYGSIFCFNQ